MTTARENPSATDARAAAPPARKREVEVASIAGTLHAQVTSASASWTLDAESAAGVDPVTAFLGALGGCLLMSLRIAARVRNAELGRAAVRVSANEKGHVKEIKVELEVQTELDDERLARLVEVAERGCHIKAMLREDIAFNLTVRRGAN
jgi:pyruvate dehydrogenase E2 component (dihydrolipoamide acetyltransferase)